ncbi:hypothetical protein GUITHDRAFT_150062 [Guillardia theta CCMP2712]|uniref:Uncharacterized protein n=2 Tax=Guillardia theta TaxID=55529 RepID=L1K212_GUITC|nr:hypothetical protein GUITHDRAFT_150062 [Guillardia theta CCMP2712]EKX54619.1 hypothetical protein GUITHDRAFT_150062 [Guillardia theta CCMP2712]|eukprot:XP_005841599.1 hypothetical protein GUITHDRAFT_150062 [Guillardia theta CCMP2712]
MSCSATTIKPLQKDAFDQFFCTLPPIVADKEHDGKRNRGDESCASDPRMCDEESKTSMDLDKAPLCRVPSTGSNDSRTDEYCTDPLWHDYANYVCMRMRTTRRRTDH